MKAVALYSIGAILICAFLYGSYWLAKNGSYWLWYEGMVKETVREMVKPDALK